MSETAGTYLSNAVNIANDLFRSSLGDYLAVITAQRNVPEAELALINTKQARFLSLTELYRALDWGRLGVRGKGLTDSNRSE